VHDEAMDGVRSMVAAAREHGWKPALQHDVLGLDIGGQDVNGTARALVSNVDGWETVDLYDPTADFKEDARWPSRGFKRHFLSPRYDVVLCTEVLEHVRWWPLVVRTCFEACAPGGLILITAAAPPRGPHSAQGLDQKPDDEWYQNVNPDELRALVEEVFQPAWVTHAYRPAPGDVYLAAIK
jgi:hypothetical protein